MSLTIAVLMTSMSGLGSVWVMVGSLVESPSPSPSLGRPSSETSITLFDLPGLLAVNVIELETPPALTAC